MLLGEPGEEKPERGPERGWVDPELGLEPDLGFPTLVLLSALSCPFFLSFSALNLVVVFCSFLISRSNSTAAGRFSSV